MRFLFLSLALVIVGSLTGCCSTGSSCGRGGNCGNGGHGGHGHTHGVCDCNVDDYCASRAPWVRFGGDITTPVAEPVAPPTKLPDGKKL